jgi:tripartite-type tricarboxylate transporter receptor subunit TctC
MIRKFCTLLVVASIGLGLGGVTVVFAQDAFYKGKTVRIVVAFSAGGGFDAYSRMIARHMGKHIPGNPNVIVENMPGAGGLIAGKHLYNLAKADGLTIGNIHGNLVMGQILGREGIDVDTRKFEWIGVPVKDTGICTLTKASGITSMEQWMASRTPVKLGGTAPGDATRDIPKILEAALNLPLQLVEGYKGGAEIRLAAEAGEAAGFCWAWDAAKALWSKALESGDATVVLQIASKPHPDLPKVPLAINYARTDEARELIDAGIQKMQVILRSYVLPPGTPKDRVQVLRRAFMETMKDQEFIADANKSKLGVDPVTGEEAEEIVRLLFKLRPSTVARLKEVLK